MQSRNYKPKPAIRRRSRTRGDAFPQPIRNGDQEVWLSPAAVAPVCSTSCGTRS